jgi:molecular chaperone DnaJ
LTDHFATLGLNHDAGESDIRAAYRLLARRYHPDMGGNHSVSAFHAVQAAWEVLRESGPREAHRALLGGSAPQGRRRRRRRGLDPLKRGATEQAVFDVRLDRTTADFGGTVRVGVPVDTACPDCVDQPVSRRDCSVCEGSGRLRLRVRATLSVPPGVAIGPRVKVYGHMELFGPFETNAVFTRG